LKNFVYLLEKEIDKINFINNKQIHPIFQTKEDFIQNIKKQDLIVLNSLNGVVVFGEEKFVRLLYDIMN
jgi:hypothetical protein